MKSDSARFHDENADAFLSQYQSDVDFMDRLGAWTALLDRHAVRGGRALDLGCGGGGMSFVMASFGMVVTGVDGSEKMIARCEDERKRRGFNAMTFLRADLPGPVEGAPFDLVAASSVIEYLPDTPEVDRWLAGLVKPGGILAFSLPNRDSVYRRFETIRWRLTGRPKYRGLVKRQSTPRDTADRFLKLGFDLLQVRYYARRPWLSRAAGTTLSSRRGDNLFAVVFRRRSS